MAKIVFYRNDCIGCGSCVIHSPKQWKISDEDGKAELINSENKNGICVLEINKLFIKENKKASEDCPSRVIKVFG